jgi:hypothetical protein
MELKHINLGRRIFSKEISRLSSNKIYVLFTFDTEEDWDNNNPLYPNSSVYYNSYKYISNGIFYQLINGFDKEGVSATLYVTPNLARDMVGILKYLENKGQTIGVHLHPHNLVDVEYPYGSPFTQSRKDMITNYSYFEKLEFMKRAKAEVESVVGHKILLYRSGKLACDNETERAVKLTGFKAISNHRGIYYIKPLDIWNLGVGKEELMDFRMFNELSKYVKHFKERAKKEQIIVFSAHPMLLYNHATDEVKEKELNIFFEFIDYLKNDENVEIINQYQLLRMVEEWRGEK